MVTGSYNGLNRGRRELQRVRGDYRRLEGITGKR